MSHVEVNHPGHFVPSQCCAPITTNYFQNFSSPQAEILESLSNRDMSFSSEGWVGGVGAKGTALLRYPVP